ncbi:MAG TPA: RIO1 family regulatory kinase/ATPase [Ktedonobacterales bacterium]|nr:RIO1 family regulatory kinase/ATPase [Ktedonobacterales bacterium]
MTPNSSDDLYSSTLPTADEQTRAMPDAPISPLSPQGEGSGVSLPAPKASYEANAEVQRWLKEQAKEESGLKPPFSPTFLAHQRDRPWVLSSLTHFYENDLITDVLWMIKSGKEATVYCCAAHPAVGAEYVAAKVYRPRMFRSLKNDAVYRRSRAVYDNEGHEVFGSRARRVAERKTKRGRLEQVASWIAYEFQTQRLLYDAGADVPRPLAQSGNAVLMEYIGGPDGAAPKLGGAAPAPEDAQALFDRILRNVELWLACDRIHGDLSPYNILYWEGGVTIIDFAQAIDPRYNLDAFPLLLRDIERVCGYFTRLGVRVEAVEIASELWASYLRGEI